MIIPRTPTDIRKHYKAQTGKEALSVIEGSPVFIDHYVNWLENLVSLASEELQKLPTKGDNYISKKVQCGDLLVLNKSPVRPPIYRVVHEVNSVVIVTESGDRYTHAEIGVHALAAYTKDESRMQCKTYPADKALFEYGYPYVLFAYAY